MGGEERATSKAFSIASSMRRDAPMRWRTSDFLSGWERAVRGAPVSPSVATWVLERSRIHRARSAQPCLRHRRDRKGMESNAQSTGEEHLPEHAREVLVDPLLRPIPLAFPSGSDDDEFEPWNRLLGLDEGVKGAVDGCGSGEEVLGVEGLDCGRQAKDDQRMSSRRSWYRADVYAPLTMVSGRSKRGEDGQQLVPWNDLGQRGPVDQRTQRRSPA